MPSTEIGGLIADDVLGNSDLLEGGRLHEVVAFVVVVEEVVGALVDVGLLDHFDRTPAGGNLHAVRNAAHIDLGHRLPLPGWMFSATRTM